MVDRSHRLPILSPSPIPPESDLFLHVAKTSIVRLQNLMLEGEMSKKIMRWRLQSFQNGLSPKSVLI